jgi:hypothetical protein
MDRMDRISKIKKRRQVNVACYFFSYPVHPVNPVYSLEELISDFRKSATSSSSVICSIIFMVGNRSEKERDGWRDCLWPLLYQCFGKMSVGIEGYIFLIFATSLGLG